MARTTANLGYKIFALAIAAFLWGVAHGSSSVERGFDLPLVLRGVPEELVVTDRSVDTINVRIRGSRAALRHIPKQLDYEVDVSGSKPGEAEFEVDVSRLELPRGAVPVSRSPGRIQLTLQSRGSKVVKVRPDLAGELAEGFQLAGVEVDPPRVRISGARSEVLRLQEMMTEAIDLTGLSSPVERTVRLIPGGRHVWVEGQPQVKVRVDVVVRPEQTAGVGESGA